MTREEAQTIRDAFNAFCEGKTVQMRPVPDRYQGAKFTDWTDNENPNWYQNCEWRVKPEPLFLWGAFRDRKSTNPYVTNDCPIEISFCEKQNGGIVRRFMEAPE